MQFNEKLKRLRTEKGMTQAELAEKVIVSRSAVAKWESGLGLPNEQSLNLLAECFDIEPSELLSDPETETVIVNKNGALSHQKVWIVLLAALLLIATILTVVFVILNSQKPQIPISNPHEPIITRELIFETEQYLYTDKMPKYDYDDLDAECEFAPSRSFAMEWESMGMYLPNLLIRTTTDGIVSYEEVNSEFVNIKVKGDDIYLCKDEHGLCAGPANIYLHFFEGYANLEYDGMTVSIKIYNVPLRVQLVEPYLTDLSKEIPLTGSKGLRANIMPSNATYPEATWNIDKIQFPDGTICQNELEKYAAIVDISDQNYSYKYILSTTEKAPIGAKIYVTATADEVTSKPLVVEVVRIPVDSVNLYMNEVFIWSNSEIMFGSENSFSFDMYPENATANILHEKSTVTLLTPELATLEETESGWTLRVTDDVSAWSEQIAIQVESSDGVSQIGYWTIFGIEVESVTLLNAETGKELDDVIYLTRGSTLRLTTVVLPEDAHYDHVAFNDFSDTANFEAYVKLSDDGVITVEKNAPIGLEILIDAGTGRHHFSKTHNIIIEKSP